MSDEERLLSPTLAALHTLRFERIHEASIRLYSQISNFDIIDRTYGLVV